LIGWLIAKRGLHMLSPILAIDQSISVAVTFSLYENLRLAAVITWLLFAGDCALTDHPQQDTQQLIDRSATAVVHRFGLSCEWSTTITSAIAIRCLCCLVRWRPAFGAFVLCVESIIHTAALFYRLQLFAMRWLTVWRRLRSVRDSLVVSVLDQRPQDRGFESWPWASATLLGARHVPQRLCGRTVYLVSTGAITN